MVIVRLVDEGVQAPTGVMVLVTVYVPGALCAKLMTPVDELTNTRPAGDEVKVPAEPPPL